MTVASAHSLLPEPMPITRVRRETADTVTLTVDASPRTLAFQPGQFNMLYAFGVGESAISISGAVTRSNEISHTIKAVGPVTRALCSLRKGSTVGVRGPYGGAWPLAQVTGRDVVVIAGGLGLAPLRPVVLQLLAHRNDYRSLTLLAGARTPGDLLFQPELGRWQRQSAMQVATIVDRAGPGWKGRVGVVPALLGEVALDPPNTVAFVCGPEIMMRFVALELLRRGLSERAIFLALERNMKCAVGHCGHCQYGPSFVCKDGPVFSLDQIRSLFWLREV